MDPDLSGRSDRLCQLAPSIYTLALCESCSNVRVSTSDEIAKDNVGSRIEKGEYGHDKRMIGCQLRVGFHHTPNTTGVTGYLYNGR